LNPGPVEGRSPWDRWPKEPARAYDTFRRYRDLGPLRTIDPLIGGDITRTTLLRWAGHFDWKDRAAAWDDEVHRLDDFRRLEAIRTMHDIHQRAGRAILQKGLAALAGVEPNEIPPYAAARLLELGARLERETLVVSVEELQGIAPPLDEDPWEAVARELDELPGPRGD
jgi:hypothetical protein